MYTLSGEDVILDERPVNQNKEYVLRVKDLPINDKPREKLLRAGATNLSSQELIAIIFSSGTRKEGVLEMAGRGRNENGGRALDGQTKPAELAREMNIPLVKALQLVACSELGRRFFQKTGGSSPTLR